MPSNRHIIRKQVIDLDYSDAKTAFDAQERVIALCRDRLPDVLSDVFDKYSDPHSLLHIPRLELTLESPLSPQNLETDFIHAVKTAVERSISSLPSDAVEEFAANYETKNGEPVYQKSSSQKGIESLWAFYLVEGYLPWWSPYSNLNDFEKILMDELLSKVDPVNIREIIRAQPQALKRLIFQFSDSLLHTFFTQLKPLFHFESILREIAFLKEVIEVEYRVIRLHFWESVFALITQSETGFALPSSKATEVAFEKTITQIADNQDIRKKDLVQKIGAWWTERTPSSTIASRDLNDALIIFLKKNQFSASATERSHLNSDPKGTTSRPEESESVDRSPSTPTLEGDTPSEDLLSTDKISLPEGREDFEVTKARKETTYPPHREEKSAYNPDNSPAEFSQKGDSQDTFSKDITQGDKDAKEEVIENTSTDSEQRPERGHDESLAEPSPTLSHPTSSSKEEQLNADLSLQDTEKEPLTPETATPDARHQVRQEPLRIPWRSKRDPEEELYIQDAGLVLVHPFIKTLFEHRQLLDEGKFANESAREKGVQLLAYLSQGTDSISETGLTFHKLLCQMPFEEPIESEWKLEEMDKTACDDLLQAVISHWKVLGKASPAGLREGFIQRDGKVSRTDNGWKVIVEKKTQDILLNKLPWGIGFISFPWGDDLISVEWA